MCLTLLAIQSTWWTIIPNTCEVPQISVKRRRRHGVVGVRWLELSERVRRAARLRYLLEPAAGGQGVAETAGGSTRATSSTVNRRAGWPQCGAQVSCTSCPCAQRCPACPLADVSHACGRPRVQETGSEASWHLLFTRRASRRWSWNFSKGSSLSAMRVRGGLRMSGMRADELCDGPCSFVGEAGACASGCSRESHYGFLCVSVRFVILAMLVVPGCRIESMSIA